MVARLSELWLGMWEAFTQVGEMLSTPYTIGTTEFTLAEWLFGAGIIIIVGIIIAKWITNWF